ncbi:hypothetical protein N185_25760 [Sinorhizobium sp. GW3]|nr:hypothetical protein N185_25760 [Sinorhizobium sp. GW3]
MFPARKALFLCSGYDAPVFDERGRAIVVKGRDTEDTHDGAA